MSTPNPTFLSLTSASIFPPPAIAAPHVSHSTAFLIALPTQCWCTKPKTNSQQLQAACDLTLRALHGHKTTIWIQQILQQSLSLSHFSATKFPTLPTQSLPCHTPIIPCHQQPTQGSTSASLTLNSNTNKTWCNLGLRANLWDFPTATQLKS